MNRMSWSFKMALRDIRGNRWQTIFFILMAALSVSAFFAISLVRDSVFSIIQSESRSILGSDLLIQGKRSLDHLDPQLKGEGIESVVRLSEFRSMARLKEGQESSFVQVVALEPDYPFYGAPEIEPKESWQMLSSPRVALIDKQLQVRHNLAVGETIGIGEGDFKIVGIVSLLPGDSSLRAMIAPRVYIPYTELSRTKLDVTGSWASHKRHIKLVDPQLPTPSIVTTLAEQNKLRIRTPQSREDQISEVVDTVYLFVALIGLVAAILATIGVITTMQAYTQANRKSVAVLRCIGASKFQVVSIFLFQSLVIALIGLIVGLAGGWGVAQSLLETIARFFAFSPTLQLSPTLILQGAGVALLISFSSFLLFLSDWKSFSPTEALRLGQGAVPNEARSNLTLLAIVLSCMLPYGLIISGLDWRLYVALAAILLITVILLFTSRVLRILLVRLNPDFISFPLRYAIRSLKRSSSLSQLLLLSIGLASSLAVATITVTDSFEAQLQIADNSSEPNVILFDIQSDQRETTRAAIKQSGLELLEEAPMVSMNLVEVNGEAVSKILPRRPQDLHWAYLREYKSSYRDALKPDEKLLQGQLPTSYKGELTGEIPVTLEKRIAENLQVSIGDILLFDVQGLPLNTKVVGIREANWRRMSPNVFVLFPSGVLEGAPQMFVHTSHIASEQQLADLSRAVVEKLSNVSIIDLRSILKVITTIAESTLFAIGLLSVFIISISILCLLQSIIASSRANAAEYRTLHVIGAQKREISIIRAAEVGILALIASLSGSALGAIAGAVGSSYLFKFPPLIDPLKITSAVIFTLLVSLLATRFASKNS